MAKPGATKNINASNISAILVDSMAQFPVQQFNNALSVIMLIAQGRTQTAALDTVGVSYESFARAVESDATGTLKDMYNAAEERGYDTMADALLSIQSHPVYGSTNPQMAKVISDNIKWFLGRKRPAKFGDKVQVDVHVSADREIINALKLAQEQAARAGVLPPPVIEDAEVIDVTPRPVMPAASSAPDTRLPAPPAPIDLSELY
jgi:hypothetical protein